jgi:dihydrofolate reductase
MVSGLIGLFPRDYPSHAATSPGGREVRKVIIEMNVSLDGFADHTVAIADDELHDFASERLDGVDIAMLGRVTYQLMASYWPKAREDPDATRSMIRFADKFNEIPKIVFSRTLRKAEWNNTRVVADDAVEEVRRLKAHPGKDMSIGGIGISQELMRHGLIDEYWLLIQPIIAGKGRRLFESRGERVNLKLVDTRTFKSGVVALHYLA